MTETVAEIVTMTVTQMPTETEVGALATNH